MVHKHTRRFHMHWKPLEEVGRVFRAARELADLSQDAFAASLEISQAQLSKIELGRFAPSPRLIRAIALKYRVDEERLRALIMRAKGWEEPVPSAPGYPIVTPTMLDDWMEAISKGKDPGSAAQYRDVPNPKFKVLDRERAFWAVAPPRFRRIVTVMGEGGGQAIHVMPGDFLFVEPGYAPAEGNVALVRLDGKIGVGIWNDFRGPGDLLFSGMGSIVSSKDMEKRGIAFRVTIHWSSPREI